MSESIGLPLGYHMLLEGRAAGEAMNTTLQLPMLKRQVPHGSGRVMVLPGFMADDSATWLLRHFLAGIGYRVTGWGQGLNRGPMLRHLPQLERRLVESTANAESMSLVGWSRGGVMARELARDRPDLVRSVVTLGSPVRGGARGTRIGPLVSRTTGISIEQMARIQADRQRRTIRVPVTAIYSRTDGVVSWQACRDETTPGLVHEEVDCSHIGMVANAEVFRKVAAALARHPG